MPEATVTGPDYAVTCYTCLTKVWEGNDPPADGQVVLTAHADKTCRREECPHRTTAIEAAKRKQAATDLDALAARVAKLEKGGSR